MKLYQRLIELGYDAPEVWNNLALCCISIGQFHVFYACFERALRMAQDDVQVLSDVWYNIGGVYILMGDLDMAKQAYTTAIGLMPDHT